jgi:SOS-response transcriptional repressor LexA
MGFRTFEEALGAAMTPRQKDIFLVIDEWWKRFGFGPSVDDVMSITGDKSRGNVHRMMNKLCEIGVCRRTKGRARSVRPVYIRLRNIE